MNHLAFLAYSHAHNSGWTDWIAHRAVSAINSRRRGVCHVSNKGLFTVDVSVQLSVVSIQETKMRCPIFLGLICLCLPDRPAKAELVLSITGPAGLASVFVGGYGGQVLTDAWNLSTAFDNVTISASIGTLDADFERGTAYLTTAIGPQSTPATLVASASFTAPLTPAYGALVANTVLFSGLNLLAASYYLSLTSPVADNGFLYWNTYGSTAVMIQAAPGVGRVTAYGSFGSMVASYVPASEFLATGDIQYLEITMQSVSEPGSAALLLAPILLVGGMTVKRSRYRLRPRRACKTRKGQF